MNTKGPFRTFDVAQGIKHLSAFVHISTCYVNAPMFDQRIDEAIYPHPLGEPEAIYDMLTKMTYDEVRNYERKVVLKTYPNTYTFSKSLTEHLINNRYKAMGLPLVIVRPSIVTAAVQEPVPGWVEGSAAANKAVLSCALGHVQEWIGDEVGHIVTLSSCRPYFIFHITDRCLLISAPKKKTIKTDLIPVDIVAKTILLSATTADRSQASPPIYHVGTSCLNPITWGLFGIYVAGFWRAQEKPRKRTSDDIRFDMFPVQEFKQRFDARFGEQIRTMAQNKDGKRLKIRISKAMAIPLTFKTFSCNQWFFDITKTLAMDDAAPKELKSGLRRGLDWHRYMEDYNVGVQDFILREKVDRTIPIDYSVQPAPQPTQPAGPKLEVVARL